MSKKKPYVPIPVPTRRIAFIDVTPELLLEHVKDRSNLPKDTILVHATMPVYPTSSTADFWTAGKIIRLFLEAKDFVPIPEGQEIPRFDLAVLKPILRRKKIPTPD